MSNQIPSSMRAVALSKYCEPSEYNLATLAVPEISKPDELLIKVHAASVNPIDVKLASGLGKLMEKTVFPYKIGYDLAGVVVAVGAAVEDFKPGDEVFSRIPAYCRGSIAEYAISTASTTAMKPATLSYAEAASLPLAAQTALQSLEQGDKEISGGLQGKTVYIPGGLSGTGSIGIQLAKNVYGAAKVITTLSTGKIPLVKGLLGGGAPDQIIDYTKEDVTKAIGKGTVDYMFDTVGGTLGAVPVMKKGGLIISISTMPSGKVMKEKNPAMPFFLRVILDLVNWFFTAWTGLRGVNYSYMFLDGNKADLDKLAQFVKEGKVKPVVGMQVKLSDIDGVRKGCQQIYSAKGVLASLSLTLIDAGSFFLELW